MRAVVTGGAGFLGSHLIDRLVAEGWLVVAVDNLITGSWDNLPPHPAVTRLERDACDKLDLDGPVDWVFHFASPASPVDFVRVPIETLRAGSIATFSMLELAAQKKAKFMLASTSEVYGDPAISPQPESYWGNVNPIGIRSVYDEAKRFAEATTMAYFRYRDVDTRIVRFFNTYGPRMRLDDGRVVPNFLTQALRHTPMTIYGDGSQTRSFGFVDDVIEAVWQMVEVNYHEPVNIGTEDEHSVLEFANLVKEVTGSPSRIEFMPALPDDPQQRRPDLTRNREILNGWQPKTNLKDGLKRTADYFMNRIAAVQR